MLLFQRWLGTQCVHRGGGEHVFRTADAGELDHNEQDETAQGQDGEYEHKQKGSADLLYLFSSTYFD